MTKEEYELLIERSLNNFADRNYEALMEETLGLISDVYDKRDGSMIYNAIAALMFEMAMLYEGAFPFVFNETYIDTSSRDGLIRRASDRSLTPWPATNAIHYAVFNITGDTVLAGTRFSCEDLNYVVVRYPQTEAQKLANVKGDIVREISFEEDDGNGGTTTVTRNAQLVQCETAGTISNNYTGTMVPIEFVEGLQKAELRHCFEPAEDEEETEHFRARLKEEMRTIAFGGNIADYRRKVLELSGVGQCKVKQEWNGDLSPSDLQSNDTAMLAAADAALLAMDTSTTAKAAAKSFLDKLLTAAKSKKLTVGGAVRIVVAGVDAEHITIDSELLDKLQTEIDPVSNAGKGYGIAPIGHVVSVVSAEETPITVALEVTYKSSDHDVSVAVQEVLNAYFADLYKKWGDKGESGLVLMPSVISYLLLDDERLAAKIESIESITIGTANAWANVTLNWDELPTLNVETLDITETST